MEITLSKIHVHHMETLLLIKDFTMYMYIIFIAIHCFSMHLGVWKKIDETLLPLTYIIIVTIKTVVI